METKKYYMCSIAWEHEFGNNKYPPPVYKSLEELKKEHYCWESCGVTELEITSREVVPTNLIDEE
jgi:hypothetical protein